MDRWIDRYRRRLEFGRLLGRTADCLSGCLLVFGSLVLVVKLLLPALWPGVLWTGLAAVPVVGFLWLLTRREAYSRSESVALLDRKLDAGGLLMTLAETPDDRWAEQLSAGNRVWRDSLPKVRPVRLLKLLALPVLFAVGACFVPLRDARTQSVLHKTVGQQAAEELQTTLSLLEEAEVLADEEEQQLREEIDKLAEETEQTPLTHEKWETVDALRDRLRMRLDSAELSVAKARQAANALSEAGRNGERLSEDRVAQLERDALQALEQLGRRKSSSPLPDDLRSDLQRLSQDGEFRMPRDSVERQKLLAELNEYLEQESHRLAELRQQSSVCRDGTCPHCGSPQQGGT